jgi:hypothetical protein
MLFTKYDIYIQCRNSISNWLIVYIYTFYQIYKTTTLDGSNKLSHTYISLGHTCTMIGAIHKIYM